MFSKSRSFFTLIFIAVGFSGITLHAQKSDLPHMEFGIIPDSLFHPSLYTTFTGWDYIIAGLQITITIEEESGRLVAWIEHHKRLKILTKEGTHATLIGLPYTRFSGIEEIKTISAQTIKKDGLIIPVDKDDIKHININSRVGLYEFQMEADSGDVVEYHYLMKRIFIEELPSVNLTHDVPAGFVVVTLKNNRYIRYAVSHINQRAPLHYSKYLPSDSEQPTLFTKVNKDTPFWETWYQYGIHPVPDEPFVRSKDDYRSRLLFQWSEFGYPRQIIESSWDIVAAELIRDNGFIQNVNRQKDMLRDVLPDVRYVDKKQRIDSLFKFVSSFERNFEKSIFSEANLLQAIETDSIRIDDATLNQILLASLRINHIEAYPVLIVGSEYQTSLKQVPSRFRFTSSIVAAVVDGNYLLLDATMKHGYPGLVDPSVLNQKGFLIRENRSYQWIALSPTDDAYRQEINYNATVDAKGNLVCEVNADIYGYGAVKIKESLEKGTSSSIIVQDLLLRKFFFKDITSTDIREIADNKINVKTTFRLEGYASGLDDGMLIQPLIVGYLLEQPFTNDNRLLPIEFNAYERLKLRGTITIPETYTFLDKPDYISAYLPGAFLDYKETISTNTLSIRFDVGLNQLNFAQSWYVRIRSLYQSWYDLSTKEIRILDK